MRNLKLYLFVGLMMFCEHVQAMRANIQAKFMKVQDQLKAARKAADRTGYSDEQLEDMWFRKPSQEPQGTSARIKSAFPGYIR